MRFKNIIASLACAGLFACSPPQIPEASTSTSTTTLTTGAIEIVTVEGMSPLGPYSTAVKSGGVLHVSGIIAFNPETKSFAPSNIEAQTKQVLANLERVLTATNTGMTDILKITIYMKNPKDFPAMNAVYAPYFPEYKPARTTVPGVDWGRDDILIEIDVIAKLP